jgi:transcriptional regulator with GAF, ATPase, and Fis domain
MSWESAFPSEGQNDLEVCHTKREYEADISTRAMESQATSSKGVNNGFENMVGVSSALRAVLALVRIVAPTNSTALIEGETMCCG